MSGEIIDINEVKEENLLQCENCFYFREAQIDIAALKKSYDCVRFPPKSVPVLTHEGVAIITTRDKTAPGDWCGEFVEGKTLPEPCAVISPEADHTISKRYTAGEAQDIILAKLGGEDDD